MKKSIVLLLIVLLCLLILGSCKPAPEVTIVGTWTLSTIQGVPVGVTGMSGSIIVNIAMTFTYQFTIPNLGSVTVFGTVADKGGNVFAFTPVSGSSFDATMNGDGTTLSFTDPLMGPVVYTK